jgi:hypothetical protein
MKEQAADCAPLDTMTKPVADCAAAASITLTAERYKNRNLVRWTRQNKLSQELRHIRKEE